ncbi:MAG: protein translocase subunit SecDF [Lewinella sp.]|nr:protein translocase subunit SecDF [Lewinella sp.]
MQGKGIVRFFLVVMALVTLVQYLFIVPTRKVENDADDYAMAATTSIEDPIEQKAAFKTERAAYLDSMSSEQIFKIPLLKAYTYQELKSQQLALGLDLAGGMSVVLQIDLREFIRTLAQNSKDPTFEEALEKASLAQKDAQADYVSLFADAWSEVRGDQRLAPIFQRNETLRDEINYETPDAEVIRVLRTKADETVDLTFQLLKQRIDKLGVVQPNVSLDSERDLIIVELPGIDNPERAKNALVAAANLEFFNVYRMSDPALANGITQANEKLRALLGGDDVQEIDRIDTIPLVDSLGNETGEMRYDTTYLAASMQGPLFDVLTPGAGAIVGLVDRNKRDLVMDMLTREEVASLFPSDLEFHWSQKPFINEELGTEQFELYAIKIPRTGEAPLSGEHIQDATAQPDPQTNQIAVSLNMDQTGARTWAQMTTEAANDNNREIAILLDGEVVSAPRVNEPITGGRSQISGGFTMQEATDLAGFLEIGRLPATTEILQESVVGPSLGAENIRRSLFALGIGFGLVFLFMILYYGGAGVVSIIALLLNIVFIIAALASYGTVLTLPGMAGIVLTIGMAVDANVIIFERVREELRDGKSISMAVADGFKNSYSAIIDANVTTLLTAAVLAYFGLGPIKGFAVVLIIGVLMSLFTAVLVGRMIIDWWLKRNKAISFDTSASRNAFANLNIDWIGKRRIAYIISGTLIVIGLGSMFTRGFELGVDFKGGYTYNVTFDSGQEVSAQGLRTSLTDAFGGNTPIVKVVDTDNTFNIVTDYLIDADEDENGVSPEERVMEALHSGIQSAVGTTIDFEQFSDADGSGTHVTSFSQVGPTIADDIQRSAFYAAIFALLLIFLYIFLRFRKWKNSSCAVAALFQDTLIVLGIFSLGHSILPFSMDIDQAFIAAILTVIGYSINDTVVVFDRIREYLHNYSKGNKTEVINAAINSTVSRTVITSLTTLFVILVLFVFGGASIKGFAFALLVGVIVGTYSSIFVASPLVHDLADDLTAKSKKDDGKKHFSRAAQKA